MVKDEKIIRTISNVAGIRYEEVKESMDNINQLESVLKPLHSFLSKKSREMKYEDFMALINT